MSKTPTQRNLFRQRSWSQAMGRQIDRYISAAHSGDKKVQGEQMRGIVASMDVLRIKVTKAQKLATSGGRNGHPICAYASIRCRQSRLPRCQVVQLRLK
jgi:hypothetical protein